MGKGFQIQSFMSSRRTPADILLRTLRHNEEERAALLRDHGTPVHQTPQRLTFFSHVLGSFFEDDEELMLNTLAISRHFFYSILNLVNSIRIRSRGRNGFVFSHKDKLLFLIVFLKEGSEVLKKVCLPVLKEPSSILRNLHAAAALFKPVLLRNTIEFRRERLDDLPTISAVVDCTVVEIHGPDLPFGEKDEYYSGKHKRHCLKKEVIVNVRSGTAAMISKAYPGSTADIEVLRRHAAEVNQMLGPSHVLADKGYRGDTRVPNCQVAADGNEAERRARVIVERFFGRLKKTFIVFARQWELSWTAFSDYFDIACGLTNVAIIFAR